MLPVVCKVEQGWTYISQRDKEVMTDNGFWFYSAFFFPSIGLHLSGKAQTSLSAPFQEYLLVSIHFWSTLKAHV